MSDKDNENTSTNSTDDLVRDLIDAVKQEEIIYKPGHKYFRHLIKKHQAYLSVSQHLNSLGYKEISAERVKQKWNTVKTMYYRHKPNCGNPCNSKLSEPGFQFCKSMNFLEDEEFKFYRNRKPNSTPKEKEKNGIMATASVSETQDGMDRLFELLNNADHQNGSNGDVSPDLFLGQINDESVNGEDCNLKRSAESIDSEVSSKRLLLLDLQVEHQRILNKKADQEVRLVKYEADLAELKLKNFSKEMTK